jgi:hypothetical protein
MKRKLNLTKMKEALSVDTIAFRKGELIIRRGFFYTHGGSSEKIAARVVRNYPRAIITDHGEVWKPFRGGASVASQSHWYVKFTFPRMSA